MNDQNQQAHKNAGSDTGSNPKASLRLDQVSAVFVIEGQATENSIRIQKPRITVGSLESSDIRLVARGVAPIHAVIELTREGRMDSPVEVTVFDLASESGVLVNAQRVVTQRLTEGDSLEIGGAKIRFFLEEIQKAPVPPASRAEGRALFVRKDEDLQSLLLESQSPLEEIFDYSVTRSPALEVVMSWSGSILDVAHFVEESKVEIGESRNARFGIPSLLSQSNHILVSRAQDRFTLHLDPKMKGVVQRSGRLETLAQVMSAHGSTLDLNRNEFAKIQIGDVTFYLCFTQAPPRLKRGRMVEHDPVFWKMLWGSLGVTLLLLVAMMNVKLPQEIEAEQLPERIATILYQPEKFSSTITPKPKVIPKETTPVATKPEEPKQPKPKPTMTKVDLQPNPANAKKPIPKEMDVSANSQQQTGKTAQLPKQTRAESRAKEGEGARAAGKEGTRGSKNAAPGKTPQDLAQRPSPQGGKGVGGGGNSEVKDVGNADLLKGASDKILDILGNSAARLGKDGERLKGFGGFTTRGSGGMALSGSGAGGGGKAETLGAGGLGEKGRGGGRVGTGLGAAGDGAGIIGGKSRVLIRSGGPEEAVVLGAVDASAIEAALLAHKDEFRLCYEREINAEKPDLAGRVGTTFVIGSQGRVTDAGVASTSLNHAPTEKCILNVIRRIDFPVPRGGGTVQVSYPFKFSPAGR